MSVEMQEKPYRTKYAPTLPGVPDVPHYRQHPSGMECKDIAGHFSYNIGTAIAYLWRCEHKHDDPCVDIRKAIDHLNFELERLKPR